METCAGRFRNFHIGSAERFTQTMRTSDSVSFAVCVRSGRRARVKITGEMKLIRMLA